MMKSAITVTPILNNGMVALLAVMGDDSTILDSARISYRSNKEKQHTLTEDTALMRYLVRHRHTSVLEMAEVKFYLKIPIFVARQLVRHRTANINEVSGRYSELPDEFYIPELSQYGEQSTTNKQGRKDIEDDPLSEIRAKKSRQDIEHLVQRAHDTYDSLLNVSGISREIARIVLPTAQMTELIWKCDLHNFFHFVRLRMDSHAQYEIRVMATAMYEAIRPLFPLACGAFEDYILRARSLSTLDQQLLSRVMQGNGVPTLEDAKTIGMSAREYTEFIQWFSTLIPPTGA